MRLKRLFETFALRHAAPHVFNDGFKGFVLGLTRENLKNVVQRDARRVKRTELLRKQNEFPGFPLASAAFAASTVPLVRFPAALTAL